MQVISLPQLCQLVEKLGLDTVMAGIMATIEQDFKRWPDFSLSPRHATHFPQGVIELMPCADRDFYSFKFVNGHPNNPLDGRLSVAAFGVLADTHSGYPLLLCEMTLLTAIRTAAVAALGAKYLARPDSRRLAIIGTGAQSEFLLRAIEAVLPIEQVTCFDVDRQAMDKFMQNLQARPELILQPCTSVAEAVADADVIVTATAAKRRAELFRLSEIKPGTHIHAMGGDCPGKTEFGPGLLTGCRLVVEYLPQSMEEGEIQQWREACCVELQEIIRGEKAGRENTEQITFFDSVGFALEDYSTLKWIYQAEQQHRTGETLPIIPQLADPKNLYSLVRDF